jgi:hypothetical protein
LIDEMLRVDLEKYMFYSSAISPRLYDSNGNVLYPETINAPCLQRYTKGVIEGESAVMFTLSFYNDDEMKDTVIFRMVSYTHDGTRYECKYNQTDTEIVDTLTDADMVTHTFKLTLYYRER